VAIRADALAASVVSLPEALVLRREARAVRDTMRSLLDRVVRRFETPAQREARLAPLRAPARERARKKSLERRLETPAQREERLAPLRAPARERERKKRASDEGQVRAAMTSALGRLERRLETSAQCEARLAPLRQARDALLAKHGSFCRCKNSKCLKRYCVCFERGELCGDSCTCENCENVAGSAALREARAAIAEQPPSRGGCTCKKSRCLKRYCDCFRDGVKCVAACKCVDCQNGRPADAPVVEADAIAAPPTKRLKASSLPSLGPARSALAPVPFKRGPWRRLLVPIAAPPKKRRRTSLD